MEALVVRKGILIASLLASVACTKKVVETTISPAPGSPISAQLAVPLEPGQIGATTSRGAVEAFLTAVKGQDLRGMSAVWGNDKEPAAARMKRDELEKRLIVMQCMLAHDKWQFAEDRARLVTGGRQEFMVELQQKQRAATTKLTTVSGQAGRWFVEDIDLAPLKEFCR
jgi:hypothetical protein